MFQNVQLLLWWKSLPPAWIALFTILVPVSQSLQTSWCLSCKLCSNGVNFPVVARRSLTSSRLVITDYWDFRVAQLEPELVLAPPSPLQSAVLKLQCIWQNKEMSSTVKETCCYLVGRLFCVKFTINYTCSSKRCDKVQWRLFFFFNKDFLKSTGGRLTNGAEESIW